MEYKPSKSELIDYLYDELADDKRERVEAFLKENPEEAQKLKALQKTGKLVSSIEEEDVLIPEINFRETGKSFNHISGFIIKTGTIAAAMVVIILSAAWSNFQLNIDGKGFQIAFGEVEQNANPSEKPEINKADVQEMVADQISSYDKSANERIEALKTSFLEEMKTTSAIQWNQVQDKLTQLEEKETDLSPYLISLQEQNIKLIQELQRSSLETQKEYIEVLLADYADYLQDQRLGDLQYIESQLTDVQQQNEETQIKTEELLASIIYQVNNTSLE